MLSTVHVWQGGEEVKPFDLLNLMVYPLDPVQTIENFFDLSFMIKVNNVYWGESGK